MTDFKVGDKVEILTSFWNGLEATVTEVGRASRGGVWDIEAKLEDGTEGIFHKHELKLVEPASKFQVGDWVEITNWGSTDGELLQVAKTPTATDNYYRFEGKPDHYGFSERYLKAAEFPQKLYNYAEFDAKMMAKVFGSFGDSKKEAVKHPAHYGGGDNPYEAIKVIEAWGLGFNLGNAAKYLARAGKKGNKVEDLNKLIQYVQFEIAKEEAK